MGRFMGCPRDANTSKKDTQVQEFLLQERRDPVLTT